MKPLEEVLLPDPRAEFLILGSEFGFAPYDISDIHRSLSKISINPVVPESIRRQFETARNLMLYSWFVYEFTTVAEMHAFAVLEFALRERLKAIDHDAPSSKPKPKMLKQLLSRARDLGLIEPSALAAWQRVVQRYYSYCDEAFETLPPKPTPTPESWFESVVEGLPKMRNLLAHGNPHLYPFGSMTNLMLCADLINALFPNTPGSGESVPTQS